MHRPSYFEMQNVLNAIGNDLAYCWLESSFCFGCQKESQPIPGKSPDCLNCLYRKEFPNGPDDYKARGFIYWNGKIQTI